mmetsp:Transcript_1376/g.2840  ORF Transcript_1376/g.2840 Transcript_1376/m.2840 type:complete len:85 (-) Transcript_1376:69-323(-)
MMSGGVGMTCQSLCSQTQTTLLLTQYPRYLRNRLTLFVCVLISYYEDAFDMDAWPIHCCQLIGGRRSLLFFSKGEEFTSRMHRM